MDRLAGLAVPDDGRFALVRDADGVDVPGSETRPRDRLGGYAQLRRPDLFRVVLDPAGLGEDLLELLLRDGRDVAVLVEDDRPRARGALIQREYVTHEPTISSVMNPGFVRLETVSKKRKTFSMFSAPRRIQNSWSSPGNSR